MYRELGERLKIIQSSYVRVYAASTMDRYWIPYRLTGYQYARPKLAEESLSYILDSGIGNDDITNEEILEKANHTGADYVLPKDYLHKQEKTTASVVEFLDLWRQSETSARPIIPLQPPHAKHYNNLPEKITKHGYYALGGVADAGPRKQVEALEEFRREVGYGPAVHALGVGTSLPIIRAIRKNPNLIDSLDTSTPEISTKNGSVPDKKFRQGSSGSFELAEGTDSSTIRAAFAGSTYLQLCYMLSPLCDDDLITESDEGRVQADVNAWVPE